jgi:6-pyruvoyl-tetrahydropterin synthase
MQLFVNDLTVIDFSYLCLQRGIVGESWIVDVLLDGSLNDENMVLDFGIVKKQIKAIIDDSVDHKLLLPMQESALIVNDSTDNNGHEYIDFLSQRGDYYLQSPKCAFAKIIAKNIDVASVTQHLHHIIMQELPENVQGLTLTLRPEIILSDYYHYSHGLRKHQGNCQRIAHGHRSKIKIYKNEQRDTKLEQQWSQRWQDIYIASTEDAISRNDVQLSITAKNNLTPDHHYFSYHAPQGRFDIAVPSNVLEVVDCDSTVELLADYIARQLKIADPDKNNTYKVVAFEGVAKGAIASV